MSHNAFSLPSAAALATLLQPQDSAFFPIDGLRRLRDAGLDQLPLPGHGATLRRWQMLAAIAAIDLSLFKLYESHTDALAVLAELGGPGVPAGSSWASGARTSRTRACACGRRLMAAMCSTDARPGVPARRASAMP